MAHEVEKMFYVGRVPWHGLGHEFIEPPSIDEAIVAAGLDWKVGLKPLAVMEGNEEDGYELGEQVPMNATVRETDGKILGCVGNKYRPLQNKAAFGFFQPYLDSKEAMLHTAGSLRGGKRVWILAKINRDNSVIVKGDEVAKFLLLSHSHDGSLAIQVGFTPIRVVCANTLSMAHAAGQSKLLRLKHTATAVDNLDKIRETINLANSQFEATADQFRELAARDINSKDLQKYVKIVLEKEEEKDKDLSTKTKNIIADIKDRFENGRGNKQKGVRGTWWAAYNSITEYLSYSRGRSQDSRINSLWFGTSSNSNEYALKQALQLAA